MTEAPLFHLVEGEGPPLLLLNGGLMSAAAWEPIAALLRQRWTVVRCDFRGQLRSPGSPPLDFAGHACDLAALLDHLSIERAHVAGTSFGALAGVALAALHPERVWSLAVITATDRLTPEMREGLATGRRLCRETLAGADGGRIFDFIAPATFSPGWLHANQSVVAERRRQVGTLPMAWFAALDRLLAAVEDLESAPLLSRVGCPALILGGGDDRTFPAEHSAALQAAIAGAELEVVTGGSHGLVLERAAEVAEILGRFLAARDQPVSPASAVSPPMSSGRSPGQ